jgi:hypothetical protein
LAARDPHGHEHQTTKKERTVSHKRVTLRADNRVADTDQVMVRFNNDADIGNALSLALASSHLYRVLPEYEDNGAVTVSVFLVASPAEAQTLTAGVGQTMFGLATVGQLRAAGLEVVATDVTDDDGELLPFSDRHADVVACAYPAGTPAYADLTRNERKTLRAQLAPSYERALRLFDPRYTIA